MLSKVNERRSREYSIRVKGVPAGMVEQSNGDYRGLVAAILVENNLVDTADIEEIRTEMEIAHPLGPPRMEKQNIIARFYARPVRNQVVRAAKGKRDLKGADRIQEDLTKIDLNLKTKAYPKMQEAFQQGKRVKFQKGKLYIDGRETSF